MRFRGGVRVGDDNEEKYRNTRDAAHVPSVIPVAVRRKDRRSNAHERPAAIGKGLKNMLAMRKSFHPVMLNKTSRIPLQYALTAFQVLPTGC